MRSTRWRPRPGDGYFDGGAFGAAGDDLAAPARAECEGEGIDDERLARAGFAGEDVEARAGAKLDRPRDGEIA